MMYLHWRTEMGLLLPLTNISHTACLFVSGTVFYVQHFSHCCTELAGQGINYMEPHLSSSENEICLGNILLFELG